MMAKLAPDRTTACVRSAKSRATSGAMAKRRVITGNDSPPVPCDRKPATRLAATHGTTHIHNLCEQRDMTNMKVRAEGTVWRGTEEHGDNEEVAVGVEVPLVESTDTGEPHGPNEKEGQQGGDVPRSLVDEVGVEARSLPPRLLLRGAPSLWQIVAYSKWELQQLM